MPAIGDTVPGAPVMITTADGPGPVSSAELLGSGTVVFVDHEVSSAESVLAKL